MNKSVIKGALITMALIAVVFRVPAIKNIVVGDFN